MDLIGLVRALGNVNKGQMEGEDKVSVRFWQFVNKDFAKRLADSADV